MVPCALVCATLSRSQSVFSACCVLFYCCWSFRLCFFLASASVFACYAGFRSMKVCLHLYNGICFQGEQCSFAHSSLELHPNADFSQLELAWELDDDASEESGA